jgi:Cu-Zn family superoxide dismutase
MHQALKLTAAGFVLTCLAACAAPPDNRETAATPPPAAKSEGEGTVTADATKRATARIEPKSGSSLTGTATFTQADGKITVAVDVEGGTPGPHGIHLHEKGDCSAPDAKSAGAHWNPTTEPHGKLHETPQAHSGDLGNIEVGADGKGMLTFSSERWTIGGDPGTDIVGKAIVIHAKADDLKTQPSGDSGDRIGCGVVQSTGTASSNG